MLPILALLIWLLLGVPKDFDAIALPLDGVVHGDLGFLDKDRCLLVAPGADRPLAVSYRMRCSSMILEAFALAPTFC